MFCSCADFQLADQRLGGYDHARFNNIAADDNPK